MFVSAGEASGDAYGAAVIAGLRRRMPEARFTGLGGVGMEAAGQDRVVRAEDVAHMGLTEVIRHAPYIWSQYWKLVGAIRRERPDVAVLIDFPDVNFRLAKHLRRAGVPVVWFVSPQLWAWKRRRLRWVQQRVNRMMVIFPFEEAFYRARGVDAEFVGHPLARLGKPSISREEYAVEYGLDPAKDWIALLPGSREKEVAANLPAMLAAAAELGNDYEFVIPVASTIRDSTVTQYLIDDEIAKRRLWAGRKKKTNAGVLPLRQAQGQNDNGYGGYGILVDDAREALLHARAAVVASGTATVQALTIGTPFVVVYRVSKLTFAVVKQMVRYPKEIPAEKDADGNLPVGMVNLIAGRRIVPELLNERFTAENVAAAVRPMLEDGPAREKVVADLAEARARLMRDSGGDPVGRVCDAVMELIGNRE